MRVRWLAVPFLALLIACGDDAAPSQPAGDAAPSPSIAASPSSTAATTDPLPSRLPGSVRLERAFPNLSFVRMTGLYQAPDGRWYVTEQRGRILVFADRPDAQAQVFLDISDNVSTAGAEEGLLGFALAPDFANTGVFYVYYSAASGPRRTVLSRFTPQGTSGRASETVLLEFAQPFPNHKGGQIAFGPDGFLYLGLGDGGSGRDPMGNGQNLGVLLGKIHRIDVSRAEAGRPYAIPADNPFVGRAGAREEIYAYGIRNPWRFSWDESGRLWLADVGQNAREEIDLVTKGGNYGWGVMEGSGCLDGRSCDRSAFTPPIFEYETGANCSITGGFVYSGAAIADLRGAYVYADYCSGRSWALRYDGSRVTTQAELNDSNIMISSFAVDRAGELYVLAHSNSGGGIFKLVP